MVRRTVRPERRWRLALRNGYVHCRQHALARRRVDGIADDADDLVARVGFESQTHALPDRLLARQILADERFVHDGNTTAAHAVGGLEVAAAAQRHAHRREPARCRGVQPQRRPAFGDIGPSPIADQAACPTAPVEEPYRGARMPNVRRGPPPPRRAGARRAHRAPRAARRPPGGSTPRRAVALARSRAATG